MSQVGRNQGENRGNRGQQKNQPSRQAQGQQRGGQPQRQGGPQPGAGQRAQPQRRDDNDNAGTKRGDRSLGDED